MHVYTCTHILEKMEQWLCSIKERCPWDPGQPSWLAGVQSELSSHEGRASGSRLQGRALLLSTHVNESWRSGRWGGVTPMWKSGKVPAERMKSLPKVIKQSPIYFSRAVTFYTKGGCGLIFFLCVVFLFMVHRKAEIVITLHLVQDIKTCTPAIAHCTPSFLAHWDFNSVLSFHAHARTNLSLILPISIVL